MPDPELRIISADSHMTEPADLWVERLDRQFRQVAPRVVRDFRRDAYLFVAPGVVPFVISTGFAAGKRDGALKSHQSRGYEAARPGGWDPAARIQDQDLDGVDAEILYPTHAMRLFSMPDAALQQACFRVYNDWIAEFASHDPRRLHALGLISLYDMSETVRELQRCRRLNLGGAAIWCSVSPERPSFATNEYDPFWQAAAEMQMPVSLHVLCGGAAHQPTRVESQFVRYMNVNRELQDSLLDVVCSGALERFPQLKLVFGETDGGWIPHFLSRLDGAYEKFGRLLPNALPMPPSEYVRRQVYFTFQDDAVAGRMYDIFGEDNYMWASDYPHADSTWPDSVKAIARSMAGLPLAVAKKVVGGNAAQLYRIEHRETCGSPELKTPCFRSSGWL